MTTPCMGTICYPYFTGGEGTQREGEQNPPELGNLGWGPGGVGGESLCPSAEGGIRGKGI